MTDGTATTDTQGAGGTNDPRPTTTGETDAPPDAEPAVPASEPSELGHSIEEAAPEDELSTAVREGSISAGEEGNAGDAEILTAGGAKVEVIIGEIPDIHDLATMLWTARCSDPEHDLLGHFDTQEAAIAAKDDHLATQH
jgi:hypothetical protein